MSALRWSGPPWLLRPQEQWPKHKRSKPATPILQVSVKPCHELSEARLTFLRQLWTRFSSFFTLLRTIAWILRCVRRCQKPLSLTFEELKIARFSIFKLAQMEFFHDAFEAVRLSKTLPSKHPLHRFVIDRAAQGHLVVRSRLRNPDARTEPMELIPLHPKSSLTKLLVQMLHRTYSHAGISAMMSHI